MSVTRTHTHTYAILEVSAEAYDEIRRRMIDSGAGGDAIQAEDVFGEVIDMHGIALARLEPVIMRREVINVRPGDMLVLSCPEILSESAHRRMKDHLDKLFPPEDNIKGVVIEGGMTLDVLRKEG